LFQIIDRRHGKASTVITTNAKFQDWGKTFADATCVAAILDRILEACHLVQIAGSSFRASSRRGAGSLERDQEKNLHE
jgi:DNA replication protein DnaC